MAWAWDQVSISRAVMLERTDMVGPNLSSTHHRQASAQTAGSKDVHGLGWGEPGYHSSRALGSWVAIRAAIVRANAI